VTLNEWKSLEITREFVDVFKRRIEEQKESLASSAGVDSRLDSWRSGVIAALSDVVHFDEETQ
jgi:hypothetical protein